MKTQVWTATMAAHLPEDVLKQGCTEFNAAGDSEARQFLLRGETAEGALRDALLPDTTLGAWEFGPVSDEVEGFCIRAAGGLGEPELVTMRAYKEPALAKAP